jgi:hypothetical protein
MIGTIALICCGLSTTPSTPLRRLALTRRWMSRMSCSEWPTFMTPRWLNMVL